MLSLLGAEGDTSFWGQYGVLIILLVLLVAFMIYSSIRRKKYDGQVQNLLDNLKVGDHVKTYSGFYGKIVSIRETTDGKVVLIEMGEGDKKGYIEADINAVMGLDKKEDVVYDVDGNVVAPVQEEAQKPAEKADSNEETSVEQKQTTDEATFEQSAEEEHVSTADKLRAKKSKKQKTTEEAKEESKDAE